MKQCLERDFDIKELGKSKYFLGIEVAHSNRGIFISQQRYVLDLLKEKRKLGSKSVDTPIEFNHGMCEDPEYMVVGRGSY